MEEKTRTLAELIEEYNPSSLLQRGVKRTLEGIATDGQNHSKEFARQLQTRSNLKVGDTLWARPEFKASTWVAKKIVRETRLSWILEGHHSHHSIKVKKENLKENLGKYGNRQWYLEKEKLELEWLTDQKNHFRIIQKVEKCKDISLLQEIDELLPD